MICTRDPTWARPVCCRGTRSRKRKAEGNAPPAKVREVPIADLGFKWIASHDELTRQHRTGVAQPDHADTVDAEVLEFIIALVDGFEGVHVAPDPAESLTAPKGLTLGGNTSRLPLARRRVIGAVRLAHARGHTNVHHPVLRVGDIQLLDASRVHRGPGPGDKARWGMYGNIATSEAMHSLFSGRFTTNLGVYEGEGSEAADIRLSDLGVRTALQQAADAHDVTVDRTTRLCTGKKACMGETERALLDDKYGEEAREADKNQQSSWGVAVRQGRALRWDDLLKKLRAPTEPTREQLQQKLGDLKEKKGHIDTAIREIEAKLNSKLPVLE